MEPETEKRITPGKIAKILALIFIFSVCGLFVLRCCMVADKSRFSSPAPTEALRAAFADGESGIKTVKVSAELADDGYFAAYAVFWSPESGEAQFAVRWNRSVYGYTDIPAGTEFVFRLENETTGESWPTVTLESDSNGLYQYRRLRAEGVTVGEEEQLTAVMELRDGFESRQILKHAEQPWMDYKVGNKLMKQLR